MISLFVDSDVQTRMHHVVPIGFVSQHEREPLHIFIVENRAEKLLAVCSSSKASRVARHRNCSLSGVAHNHSRIRFTIKAMQDGEKSSAKIKTIASLAHDTHTHYSLFSLLLSYDIFYSTICLSFLQAAFRCT